MVDEPDGEPSLTIAVLGGTGKLGSALAERLVRAGHAVVIGSRDAARARHGAAVIGERVGGDAGERIGGADNAAAAVGAEVIVLTVPFEAQEATLRGVADVVDTRVVISTAVPVRFEEESGPVHVDVAEGSASQQVAALLPRARVVGALQTVSSATLARTERSVDADIIVTGDDPAAKLVAARLLAALPGIRVIDGGPLRNARYVEQLTVLLLSINMRARRSTGIRITNLPDDRTLLVVPSS